MSRPIGYYVHHQGDGHRQRAIAIGQALENVMLMGSGLAGRTGHLRFLDLPDDRLDESFAGIDHVDRPSSLHYAPLDHEGVRQRTALITGWIAQARPCFIVVDVSVEVAMLARLASVPTVYVRLSGNRLDPAHLDTFRAATALIAPFHAALDDEDTPCWVRDKTFYAPGIVRSASQDISVDDDVVLVVLGRGGGVSNGDYWARAARAAPAWRWHVIGPCTVPADMPANLQFLGWVDDADARIATARVVIGAAGDGVVSAVLAARRPFICMPELRPFDEQASKANRLAAVGGAIVRHDRPQPDEWLRLISLAIEQNQQWPVSLDGEGGPERVARWLNELRALVASDRSDIV